MKDLLASAPKNWGRWGPDDELGSLNFLTQQEVLRGIRSVRLGEVYTLGELIANPKGEPVFPGRTGALKFMTQDKSYYKSGKSHSLPGGGEYSDDGITMYLQGSTQYDAMGHFWYDDHIWNGYSADTTMGGMEKASIVPIGEKGVVGHKGEEITLQDIKDAASKQGVTIEKHDILVIRTAFLQSFYEQSREEFYDGLNEPGMTYSPELVQWFHQMEIPALCTDTMANELTVHPESKVLLPLHCALLRNLGIAFNEICNLEKLAAACERHRKYDFLYVGAPLKVYRGTGAPVNPVAIL
ncbi:hypothetical protein Gasu2_52230 [Galdieria sulphuraria]|nr:hypothetical protein Gasu2_52230 [Galdieria sulphuraria]